MYKKEKPKDKEVNVGVENALRDIKAKYGDGSINEAGRSAEGGCGCGAVRLFEFGHRFGRRRRASRENNRNLRSGILRQNHLGLNIVSQAQKKAVFAPS